MAIDSLTFSARLQALSLPQFQSALPNIKHGVEREALRVNPNGGLATTVHPTALGATLTHETITTDFSEALLEFITPPEQQARVTLAQLADIHKYVYENIGDERLWPMSMPCFVNSETNIPIARYGSSNVGQMKEVYRKGLHNRYGSMMQVIAGVHFNFSLSDDFWQAWCDLHQLENNVDNRSTFHFDLIRNFRRLAWLIPYLYGASPALCQSFLAGKEKNFPFKKLGVGTLYLPFATSLRMSDLGYTNSEQSSLNICYNDLQSYVKSVRVAINTASEHYKSFPSGQNGEWQQLNDNVLQIENELYSPIRPKQVAKSLEKPSDALEDRGVSYIEVRALDVNPFSPLGIEETQFHFLDVFLLYCLASESPKFTSDDFDESESNLDKVVLEGRKPGLLLENASNSITLVDWANQIFVDLEKVAKQLDTANNTVSYSQAVATELKKVNDASLTPSAKWLDTLLEHNIDNSRLGLELAQEYREHVSALNYLHFDEASFVQQAKDSIQAREAIEASDTKSFNDFIEAYFA
ncbi:glutamate--cysteine ligase [Glaciecola sp. MH2013]|uniref:glutamate--cysteine ligase n=1 Tax=Glaciecola sp. MH2013 TaxID=2785524 RepID=UPI00189F8138|nr:glutamate--cysteine ligase [Glaciecola sp. MH2013]MBF7072463.1 glutamate--cysteine ligase [Glaciecola sp. MH2013]